MNTKTKLICSKCGNLYKNNLFGRLNKLCSNCLPKIHCLECGHDKPISNFTRKTDICDKCSTPVKQCPCCKVMRPESTFKGTNGKCGKCYDTFFIDSKAKKDEDDFLNRWDGSGKTTPTFYDKLKDPLWSKQAFERDGSLGQAWSVGKKTSYRGSIQQHGPSGEYVDSKGVPNKGKIDLDDIFKDFDKWYIR